MDAPQPEEDDVLIALDPLDVVERVLMAENLSFDRTEDGDLAFTLAGDWKDYELWFAWRPEADCLQLCLSIDRRVEKLQRPGACELANLVNQRVWVGHFEVWSDDGEVVFRHAMALPEGERPTPSIRRSTSCWRPTSRRKRRSPPACSRPSARPEPAPVAMTTPILLLGA